MKATILLRRLRISGANCMAGMAVAGYPALTSFLGFAQVAARSFAGVTTGRSLRRFGVIHHTGHPRFYPDKFRVRMTQKRAVYQIEEWPNKKFLFTPQEDIRPQIDFEASLILEIDIDPARYQALKSDKSLCRDCVPHAAMGGSIVDIGRIDLNGDAISYLATAGRGQVIVDRSELLRDNMTESLDALDILMDHIAAPREGESPDRNFATHIGYAAISPLARRTEARGPVDHCHAEPVLAPVAFRRLHRVTTETPFMWRPMIDRDKGIFIIKGENAA